ncbi:3-keto-5-aminohexanoate cleavage protein [Lujinxingia litoralis]|uniref:3-keto-5-aminohexanoate cleavage protein n=1 Tax=Lujinxingia litoralis TaxID=2211119 RepID=A0A328CC13_9DELT|nr:3-keto-5-aminohexanoate cleavage protein [Lujinxingia litoralis]RAL23067.1 3-keto-5-aminohexanoate cleavage protein [Lujinxingia litoralis]
MAPSPDPVVITCALNGAHRDPAPRTPVQMADEARQAYEAGASMVHLHLRDPQDGQTPSWDPARAREVADAILARVPDIILNLSTDVIGNDLSGPRACLEAVRPEMAALNAGSLNDLKLRRDGQWAEAPTLVDNPVSKIGAFLELMAHHQIVPECECFDTGIVRSLSLLERHGLLQPPYLVSFVLGMASGMPARQDLMPILLDEAPARAPWQSVVIGGQEVWPIHRRTAELGGHLRTGVEDTLYLPDGTRVCGNGPLIEAMTALAREVGREPATPAQARAILLGHVDQGAAGPR